MNSPNALKNNAGSIIFFLKVLDIFTPLLVLYGLVCIYSIDWGRSYILAGVLASLMLFSALRFVGVYRFSQGAQASLEAFSIVRAWALVILGLLVLSWAIHVTEFYSRIIVGLWVLSVPAVIIIQHIVVRQIFKALYRSGRYTRKAVIVGAGSLGRALSEKIEGSDSLGIELIGFVDDDASKPRQGLQKPMLGHGDDILCLIEHHGVDMVFLALPTQAEMRVKALFEKLQATTVSVLLVPDLFVYELMNAKHQDIEGMPVFALCETPFWGAHGVAKRLEDIILTSIILCVIWPVMALLALGVKFSSSGPVLFKQRRHGLDGRVFHVYKFRSMSVCEDGEAIKQAQRNDPRVTPLGAFIRKTSMDELPQLFNVLKGEMSLVGPRPHAVAHNEEYRKLVKRYVWRHKVKPGITGWAQVNGWRGETDTLEKMDKRVEYDLWYIANWSIWIDIKILCMTLWTVVARKNAY